MRIRCHYCGKGLKIGEPSFEGREKVTVRCPACEKLVQVTNPKLATLRVDPTRRRLSSPTDEVTPDGRLLCLPENQDLSLKVLDGEEKGTVFPVSKPRLTIGRANADIVINDPMTSRIHCALEVSDEEILLRDLESTNGTLVNGSPVKTAKIGHGSTFQVGGHVFQLVVTPKPA